NLKTNKLDKFSSIVACNTAIDFRGSFRLALQSPARSTSIHETYVDFINEKIRTSLILNQESNSFGSSFNENTFVSASFLLFIILRC
ncbi:hypothetical protein, partial [Priestia megaterium]|uniref:hypothetical protein n=1 Tax=Priestia megaterium TaxID=1404 RepID=UPI002E1A75A7|nr:hypothetical protein [Priestia megaterium]